MTEIRIPPKFKPEDVPRCIALSEKHRRETEAVDEGNSLGLLILDAIQRVEIWELAIKLEQDLRAVTERPR